MKKLMLTAAAVAMAGVASAATQVYDIKINLKTTTCKTANIAANQNPFRAAAGQIEYRAQGSLTIAGLIWACGCDYLVDCGDAVNAAAGAAAWRLYVKAHGAATAAVSGYDPGAPAANWTAEGYAFWNAKTRAPWGYSTTINKPAATADDPTTWALNEAVNAGATMPKFTWAFLQRIGARAEKVEGAWTLEDCWGGPVVGGNIVPMYSLTGAGFGNNRNFGAIGNWGVNGALKADATETTSGNALTQAVLGEVYECEDAAIASMSGNCAGYIDPQDNGCVFCDGGICPAFPFCKCYVNKFDNAKTAAYGTWTIKYNASLSNGLMLQRSIRDVRGVNFSADMVEYVRLLEGHAL